MRLEEDFQDVRVVGTCRCLEGGGCPVCGVGICRAGQACVDVLWFAQEFLDLGFGVFEAGIDELADVVGGGGDVVQEYDLQACSPSDLVVVVQEARLGGASVGIWILRAPGRACF